MLVSAEGATGAQVASIFNAFGTRVQLFEAGPRILATEDADIAAAVATAFRESGMVVRENYGAIESFEKTAEGVRMNFIKDGRRDSAEAVLVVVAVGWVADTEGLNLAAARVELNARKFVQVDEIPAYFGITYLCGWRYYRPPDARSTRTTAGFVAATNAVLGPTMAAQQ